MLHGAVGVAPSTTVVAFPDYNRMPATRWNPYADLSTLKNSTLQGGLGVIDPKDWWQTGQAYGLPGTATLFLPSNGGPPKVLGGANTLGIIGNEITRSLNGDVLGAIPTDFELATYREYLPVQSGWVEAYPKGSQNLGGFGAADSADTSSSDVDVELPTDTVRVKCMKRSVRHQKLALRLQMVTTAALAFLAVTKLIEMASGKKG